MISILYYYPHSRCHPERSEGPVFHSSICHITYTFWPVALGPCTPELPITWRAGCGSTERGSSQVSPSSIGFIVSFALRSIKMSERPSLGKNKSKVGFVQKRWRSSKRIIQHGRTWVRNGFQPMEKKQQQVLRCAQDDSEWGTGMISTGSVLQICETKVLNVKATVDSGCGKP